MDTYWEDFTSQFRLQKDICAFCEKTPIKQTYQQYLLKGNICQECSSKILKIHMDNILKERQKRLQDKKDRMETLGNQLEHDLGEEERKEIVDEMMRLHQQITYGEIELEVM